MTCVVLQTIMVKMYNPIITKPLSILGVGVETLYVPYLNIICPLALIRKLVLTNIVIFIL